ncbi:indolepyruvate ferredoxin oxidoreductase family protein [Kordiimonas lacus]|uniref:Indolepyruvate ferredoxin oxidoreductase n=1 Tax=Kordiimonas lacus TaxID=637679 RepID=A0A1G7F5S6_9PROT|nr:indolepyruvate ferredoxin oxidoreductase family protein [Kordiimonas lacus]SDE71241.1 indolepyruvate ferredoxin oxidoreductase [Kordiimonas lacus]
MLNWKDLIKSDNQFDLVDQCLISGTQCLALLPLLQRQLDKEAGLNTRGYISGYRGSPLGGVDFLFEGSSDSYQKEGITFHSAINEDLAATAIWGTQQTHSFPTPKVDGVFALWYGKGPGVDRSCDAIRHGNQAGTNRNGGVLVVFGDDHPGKSSTTAHQSEPSLMAVDVPILSPSTLEEILYFGLLGWHLSRQTGLWVGLKMTNESSELLGVVSIKKVMARARRLFPEGDTNPELSNRWGFTPQLDNSLIENKKLPLFQQLLASSPIDEIIHMPDRRTLGIVSTGKAYLDTLDALALMGISLDDLENWGLGLLKIGSVFPVEEDSITEFAKEFDELVIIEEKKPIIENQIKSILYQQASRPRITGKYTPEKERFLPSDVQLDAALIASRLCRILSIGKLANTANHNETATTKISITPPELGRVPFFCSGCPHSRSTRLPDDSFGLSGIGCHGMAAYIHQRTFPPTHMGGEGANWIGLAPYVETEHIFQNLGDGTYTHSGLLAIRAAVAAGVNITYKILFNGAVAMTGGQPVEGAFSVSDIVRQVAAEGVRETIVVVPSRRDFALDDDILKTTTVYERSELDIAQNRLRKVKGVSALIFAQECAAELRRKRKKTDNNATLHKRLVIDSAVCEGCGDCASKSKCLSIVPTATEEGIKRKIDQSSCNMDFSCIEGFCPSFISIEGKARANASSSYDFEKDASELPRPTGTDISSGWQAIIAGVGGGGSITFGQILSTAAFLEGKQTQTFNMTGLAQKSGAVYSHIKIGTPEKAGNSARIQSGCADMVFACDVSAAVGAECVSTIDKHNTSVVVNPFLALINPEQPPQKANSTQNKATAFLSEQCHENKWFGIEARYWADELFKNHLAVNMIMLGFAFQKGLIPLGNNAILAAIKNHTGRSANLNTSAFHAGRLIAAGSIKRVQGLKAAEEEMDPGSLASGVHKKLLTFQDQRYADSFSEFFGQVMKASDMSNSHHRQFAITVAKSYLKLFTYKDEYEVARLLSQSQDLREVLDRFEPGAKVRFHLVPPVSNFANSSRTKIAFGPWIRPLFSILKALKFLRGSIWDPFGYTKERRQERHLCRQFRDDILALLPTLGSINMHQAISLARAPQKIRGFGHVKEKSISAYREERKELLLQLTVSREQKS